MFLGPPMMEQRARAIDRHHTRLLSMCCDPTSSPSIYIGSLSREIPRPTDGRGKISFHWISQSVFSQTRI